MDSIVGFIVLNRLLFGNLLDNTIKEAVFEIFAPLRVKDTIRWVSLIFFPAAS